MLRRAFREPAYFFFAAALLIAGWAECSLAQRECHCAHGQR